MIFAVFIIINSGIMANKKTDMSKLRQILRLHGQGERKLKISELTGVSRNTLKKIPQNIPATWADTSGY